jgi:hypothetical protein
MSKDVRPTPTKEHMIILCFWWLLKQRVVCVWTWSWCMDLLAVHCAVFLFEYERQPATCPKGSFLNFSQPHIAFMCSMNIHQLLCSLLAWKLLCAIFLHEVLNIVLCSSATDTVFCSSLGKKNPTQICMQQNRGHARTAPIGKASSFSSPESPPVYLPLCIYPSHTLFICFLLFSTLR